MRLLKNLQFVSEMMFFAYGAIFLFALVFHRNNFMSFETEMIGRLLDVPFALVGIIFAITSLRISFNEQLSTEEEKLIDPNFLAEAPLLDAFLILTGVLLFLVIVFVNFAFPDLI